MKASLIRSAALFAGASLGAVPAAAQPAQVQRDQIRQVIVYGNDPCPRGTGDEIIVCARRPETERYRLRQNVTPPDPADQRSALTRDQEVREAAATGTDSCSPVGPGGQTGCLQQQINRSRVGIDRGTADNPSNPDDPQP
jgi:hypothetical protein